MVIPADRRDPRRSLELSDPVLVARKGQERRYIDEVCQEHGRSVFMIPWHDRVLEGSVQALGDRHTSAA